MHRTTNIGTHAADTAAVGHDPSSAGRTLILRQTETTLLAMSQQLEQRQDDFLRWAQGQSQAQTEPSSGRSLRRQSPFRPYLAQVKHRLAQNSLLLGNTGAACNLLRHILGCDADVMSPSATAMAWYDMALVYFRHSWFRDCRQALDQSLRYCRHQFSVSASFIQIDQYNTLGPDDTLLFFIRQLFQRLQDITPVGSNSRPNTAHAVGSTSSASHESLPPSLWSCQFGNIVYTRDGLISASGVAASTMPYPDAGGEILPDLSVPTTATPVFEFPTHLRLSVAEDSGRSNGQKKATDTTAAAA